MEEVSAQEKFSGFVDFFGVRRIFAKRLESKEESFCGGRRLPLYEYRCTVCGYSFEKIQSFSAKPETECPKCQGVLIRPVTAPALRFEGAGWYVNDYAGKGATKPDEATSAPAAEGAKAAESKPASTESSPAATPAPAAASPAPTK